MLTTAAQAFSSVTADHGLNQPCLLSEHYSKPISILNRYIYLWSPGLQPQIGGVREGVALTSAKLAMQHIKPVYLSRIREHILQLVRSHEEILTPRTGIVIVSGLSMRKRLEYAERCLAISQAKPRSCVGLFVHAIVDVTEEAGDEIFLAFLGLQLNEVGFAACGIVDALDDEAGVRRVVV